MLGSKRLSNHHRRTPDVKETQEFPQNSFSIIKIQEPKTVYNEKLSPLNMKERYQNPDHLSNGWLRLKDQNVLING